MGCCHAYYLLDDTSDRAFTLSTPNFTFGPGCLAEAGANARELGLARVALYTDPRLAASEHVSKVQRSLTDAGCDVAVYAEVAVEPDTASFQAAARFATEGQFDGFVSVGGGSVIDTCKAANLYSTYPADFMAYVNVPIGGGVRVPGRLKPHIACPTTSGTGSETTGISIFNLTALNAKTGIISRRLIPDVALVDPEVTATLPAKVVASSGFDCLHHALESITSRAWVRRLNPARGVLRPVSQGANPFSDLLAHDAIRSVGRFLVRATRDPTDTEARTEMMYAAMLAGIAFNAAGCHLPHGLSYAVSGLVKDRHIDGYPPDKGLVPHGMAVTLHGPSVFRWTADACPDRHLTAAGDLGADIRGAIPRDAGEILAGEIIGLMRATGMPNGLSDLGLDHRHLDALTAGAEPQWRVIRNAPKDVTRDDLRSMFDGAMRYW